MLISVYSLVPNKRGDFNKRGKLEITANQIKQGDRSK